MKKIMFLVILGFISVSVNAQLTNSKWKGSLQLDNVVDVVFDFRTDTLEAFVVADNSSLEVMKYNVKDNVLSIQKVSGQSDCADTVIGKYKIDLKDNELTLTAIEDECNGRFEVLNNTKWTKE